MKTRERTKTELRTNQCNCSANSDDEQCDVSAYLSKELVRSFRSRSRPKRKQFSEVSLMIRLQGSI